MADRAAARAFNQASVRIDTAAAERTATCSTSRAEKEEAAPDAIKRILDAWDSKDYFSLMLLPEPTSDDLGRPEWGCTPGDVSRAYRKLSVLVHPDKNPGEKARKAFEALNVR